MTEKRPNILLFCVDQMQSYCLGANGHREVQTPNLDALAKRGVNFTRAYVNNPVCMPSRAGIFTGRTPRDHGLLTNGCKLPESIPTIVDALRQSGYRTHAAGKLHLQPTGGPGDGSDRSLEGRRLWSDPSYDMPMPYYGFESVDLASGHGFWCGGHYPRWLHEQDPDAHRLYRPEHSSYAPWPDDPARRGFRLDLPEELHYNQWIAQRSIDFIEQQFDRQPFFLWCSFPDPHHPFAACRPYSTMYDPASLTLPATFEHREDNCATLAAARMGNGFNSPPDEAALREILAQTYGMVSHVDACVGRVLNVLKQRGLADNTLIGFISDHGDYLGSHGLLLKAIFPYEEVWRVPMIWHLPTGGDTQAEQGVVSLLDVAPTLADAAGLPSDWYETRGFGAGPRPGLPGRSLFARIAGERLTDPRPALIEYDEDCHGDMPLCRQRGLVTERYKLVTFAGRNDGVLFDLQEDPLETVNRFDDAEFLNLRSELTGDLLDRLILSERFDTRRYSHA